MIIRYKCFTIYYIMKAKTRNYARQARLIDLAGDQNSSEDGRLK